jgi:hypothetical protein
MKYLIIAIYYKLFNYCIYPKELWRILRYVTICHCISIAFQLYFHDFDDTLIIFQFISKYFNGICKYVKVLQCVSMILQYVSMILQYVSIVLQ